MKYFSVYSYSFDTNIYLLDTLIGVLDTYCANVSSQMLHVFLTLESYEKNPLINS